MNLIRMSWWRFMMDLRPMVRFLAERSPRWAGPAVRTRTLLHLMVGNPAQLAASLYGLTIWNIAGFWWGIAAWAMTAAAIELALQTVRVKGGHRTLMMLVAWREAWRVRRRWPADWAIVAAKTIKVQAEVGTSKEPIASARLRPVADHPKMSWWPRISWPVVSWWVGPPPGRSFAALDEVSSQLAANISHCVDVAIDFDRESDSHGRLIVTFVDPLHVVIDPHLSPIEGELPRPAAEDDAEMQQRPPTLRIIGRDWDEF